MKRTKPIPSLGHREAPAAAPDAVKCLACYEVRPVGKAWRVPCSRRDKGWPVVYMSEEG